MTSIKERLANNRTTTPLFDTKTYTQNLEKSFGDAYSLYQDGDSTQHIWVHGRDQ